MTTWRKYAGPLAALVATLTIGAVMVVLPGSASAGAGPIDLVVDTLDDNHDFDDSDGLCDDGPEDSCSLREAVAVAMQSGSGGNITFGVDGDVHLSQEIVLLADSDPTVTITGNGVENTVLVVDPQVAYFRGGNGNEGRHFYVGGTDLVLEDMTLRDGTASNGGSVAVTTLGSLTTRNVHFLDNTARSNGGAVHANADNDTVEIHDTTFAGNHAGQGGGAIWVSHDTVTVENSTFTANSAPAGAAIGVHYHGTLSVDWSTFSGNTATKGEGEGRRFRSMRSTSAAAPQGEFNGASTIFSELDDGPGADVTISHSILEKTTGLGTSECAGSPIVSGGANIVDDQSCGFTSALDVEDTAANVGPLQDNGGATFTMALTAASAAVDVDPATCDLSDQRGLPRNVDGDVDGTAACDSGAYELQVTAPTTTGGSTTSSSSSVPDGGVDANTAKPATPTVARPTFTG